VSGAHQNILSHAKDVFVRSFVTKEKSLSRSGITPTNIHPCLYYQDAAPAMEWLCKAFGSIKRLVVPGPNGTIAHAELSLGPDVIMVSSVKPDRGWVSPRSLPAVHQALGVHVDDPDRPGEHWTPDGGDERK
jgi:hypothetical protein